MKVKRREIENLYEDKIEEETSYNNIDNQKVNNLSQVFFLVWRFHFFVSVHSFVYWSIVLPDSRSNRSKINRSI